MSGGQRKKQGERKRGARRKREKRKIGEEGQARGTKKNEQAGEGERENGIGGGGKTERKSRLRGIEIRARRDGRR